MNCKPDIPRDMIAKWQRIVDILAQLLEVPSGLIMKTEPPRHFIYINSTNDENPFRERGMYQLNTGLYCDRVIQDKSLLVVDNATIYPQWADNPDMKHNMLFYMGLPLVWPDGEIFGTICVLDSRTNHKAMKYVDLLTQFGGAVNCDLKFLTELAARKRAQAELLKAHEHLEQRVVRRTGQLLDANTALKKEISVRRRAEASLLKREAKLEEANTALRVLLEQVEHSRETIHEQIFSDIHTSVTPYINKLKRRTRDRPERALVDILEANVNGLSAPFNRHLSAVFAKLTPAEIEVARLIRLSKTTKAIAGILNVAPSTVDFHRNNIRRKTGIKNARMNLKSFLSSLN